VTLLPACYPDVVLMHVHRCDAYGNAQIDGITIEDFELARAARRLIVTTEKIIDNEAIRESPQDTVIPYYLVDAVIELPYAAHPTLMPGLYYFDEHHIGEWLRLSTTEEGVAEYLDRYVFGVDTFDDYLDLIGGADQLEYLRQVEHLEAPLEAPWLEEKRK